MKNTSFWLTVSVIATLVPLMGMSNAHAYDDLPLPPPLPKDWVPPPKPTEKSVVQQVETQTRERFAAAAGGDANGQLSQAQAKAAGWGFVSDHFIEIDSSGSGYVRLDDVLRFISQRTPQRIMSMKAAAQSNSK